MSQLRDMVEIDDARFEVKLPGELSLEDHKSIMRVVNRAHDLPSNPAERSKLVSWCNAQLLSIALTPQVSLEVLNRLNEAHLESLVSFVMESLEQESGSDAGEPAPDNRNTVPLEEIDWANNIPMLQRFYGAASPSEWERLPFDLLQAHMERMDVIQAKEALYWSRVIAVGNGLFKRNQSRSIIKEWRSISNGLNQQPKLKPASKESFLNNIQSVGFTSLMAPPTVSPAE